MINITIKVERTERGISATMKSDPVTSASQGEIFMATMLMDAVKEQIHAIMQMAGEGRLVESLFTICPTCQTPQRKADGVTIYQCPKCKKEFAAPLL